MVHFNTRLRDNTFAEWRHDYLDYKHLKRALKQQQQQQLDHGYDEDLDDWEAERETETEAQTLLRPPSRFDALLAAEYDKVEAAYVRHVTRLRDELALLRVPLRAEAPRAAQDSVRHALTELHRLANHLVNFALLNYTGFVKITKKRDKWQPPALPHRGRRKGQGHTTEPPPPPQQQPRFAFQQAHEARALLRDIETLFAELFCDGNHAVAAASLLSKKHEVLVNWTHVYMGIKLGACLLLLIWVGWDSLIVPTFRTEREEHLIDLVATRAYPVYRGLGGCLLLHWLLGVSLYVWHSARINFRYIFALNPRTTPHYTALFSDATNMTMVFLVNVLLYYKVVNGYFPEKHLLHRGYYPLTLFVYAIYFYGVRHWRRQRGLARVVLETMAAPFFSVTFLHVFVGDYLTSTVKVMQDLAWSVCFFSTKEFLLKDPVVSHRRGPLSDGGNAGADVYYPSTATASLALFSDESAEGSYCRNNFYYVKLAVPLICALPLWWRFLQSLRRVHDTHTWWPNLPNAFKYALAQVVALFGVFHPFYVAAASLPSTYTGSGGAMLSSVQLRAFQLTWLALFSLSSMYTWIWDVWMDWGLGRPEYKFLGDRQMFSRRWVYYVAIVADLFLRFAWTMTLIPPHSFNSLLLYFQPFTMVLELIRRTFWGFFRLENEHLRNTQGFRRTAEFIPLHYDHGVGTDAAGEGHGKQDEEPQLSGRVFLLKILGILFLVLGLSVLAIIVEQ